MGEIISFDTSKTNEKLHVVFSFDSTKDAAAVYDVKREGPPDDSDTFINTSAYLTKWIKENWKTIEYSLGGVAPTPVDGALYLTPEHIAFTIYPTTDGSNGCLSLYIKTKGSGYQNGYATPVFRLSNGDSVPIPSGHTASIIIRREIVERFLTQALENATAYGDKVLTVRQSPTTTGFTYVNKLNDKFRSRYIESGGMGDEQIDIDWNFDRSPVNVEITDNQCRWRMNFETPSGGLDTARIISAENPTQK